MEKDEAVAAYAEEEHRSIYFHDASSKIHAEQENWVHVAIDDMSSLASIKFSIRFLEEQITIGSHGLASFTDVAIHQGRLDEGCLTYSIVYSGAHEGTVDLVGFTYATKPGVFGSVSFLVTVEEAYDFEREPLDIRGMPFSASIVEAGEEDIPMKKCTLAQWIRNM